MPDCHPTQVYLHLVLRQQHGRMSYCLPGKKFEAELDPSKLDACAEYNAAFNGDELRLVLPGFPDNLQGKGVVEIAVKQLI